MPMNNKYDNIAVLIPAYKPDERLITLVDDLLAYGFTRIVTVDDGGGAAFRPIFEALQGKAQVLVHEVNRGKGAALKTGIAHIMQTPGVAVVTADADGQHAPKDVAKIADALLETPEALVLGSRDKAQMPPRSKAGNTITCAVFAAATFHWVGDTQTGLRGLPAASLADFSTLEGDRYEYEMNMLLYACHEKIKIREVTIETIYIGNNETSHFNPIKDGMKIYALIFRKVIKFLTSSVLATVIDYVMFILLYALLKNCMPGMISLRIFQYEPRLLCSIVGARIVSALCNYTINRKVVFKSDRKDTLWKYAALAVCIIIGDYVLIRVLQGLGLPTLVSKVIADVTLFLCSYRVQDRVIFKK